MTIGIIGAMDEEIAFLKQRMTNIQQTTIANTLFIQGTLENRSIVLLKSGIGKVNAAMATTILHEQYKPSCIINTGSAGGFLEELNVGDIVISTEVVHHDVDVTAFDYAYGQVAQMPPTYHANERLINKTMDAIKSINIQFAKGLIATGDSFMDDENRVAFIRKKFPNMIAAEMEAAAIAQVCYQYNTPFVVIRALSDIAGKESVVSFDEFLDQAATNASKLIVELVKTV